MEQRVRILEPLIRDSEIAGAAERLFPQTQFDNPWHSIVPLLIEDFARNFYRLFLDQNGRSPSVSLIVKKMKEPTLFGELRLRFSRSKDQLFSELDDGIFESLIGSKSLTNLREIRADQLAFFDQEWALVETDAAALQEDASAKKVRRFRDKYIAHLDMGTSGLEARPFSIRELDLTKSELFDLVDRHSHLPTTLFLLITLIDYPFDQVRQLYTTQGRQLWNTLLRVDG